MDLKKYNELRKKINKKDFEGNNVGLDKWLYRFSLIGNVGSIFFAYFLVYPSLLNAITINLVSGFGGNVIAFIFTLVFLVIFEISKRYLIRNFSSDYVIAKGKLNTSIFRWMIISIGIVSLSFYLSISGSRNLATTNVFHNNIAETEIDMELDSLLMIYDLRIITYQEDNETLRRINNDLRQTLLETPLNFIRARTEYQNIINDNVRVIEANQNEINRLNLEKSETISTYNEKLNNALIVNQSSDFRNIILFVIIVIFIELIIIGGIFFREYFEYKLYEINHQKFEKIYMKKDRYRSLLSFIYGNGTLEVGSKVVSVSNLKTIVAEKSTIANSNKLVDEFLQDMDSLGILVTNGKRRLINAPYNEALNILENYDNAFRALENMK